MRTLTSETLAAAAGPAPQPVTVLRLVLPAETLHYADAPLTSPVAAEGRVLDWFGLDQAGPVPARRGTLTLGDPDGALRARLADPGLTGAPASVLLHFRGLGESDLVPLLEGAVAAATWREEGAVLALELAELTARLTDRRLGTVATRERFPRLPAAEEGRMLPIVYGRPHRVRAVLVRGGAETELARRAGRDDTSLIVRDASGFPAGALRLRLGTEVIEGSFSGNTFAVTGRGCALQTGTTTETSGSLRILRDANLPAAADGAYAGLFLTLTLGGREQVRRVIHSVAAGGALVVHAPFLGADGDATVVPAGTAYRLGGLAAEHPAGEAVREVLDEYVAIAADHPVQAVESVEAWGVLRPQVRAGGETIARERRGYLPLPPAAWRATTADAATFPELGRAVTTVTLAHLPTALAGETFLADEIVVTLRGAEEAGSLVENPARVLAHLLRHHGGVAEASLDDEAFDAAAAARADWPLCFALTRPGRVLALAADLARQACLALTVRNGALAPAVLHNDAGAPVATLDAAGAAAGGAVLETVGEEEILTEIEARYTHRGTPAGLTVRDADAAARHGRRREVLECWALAARHLVRAAAEWWLRRRRHRYRRLRLATLLGSLPLERGDTVTIDRPALLPAGQTGVVERLDHRPGNPREGRPDARAVTLRLPVWAGCTTTCEHACETSGCEAASCELACTAGAEVGCAWSCETSCEEACQLSCMTTCELACQATCQLSSRAGGPYPCESTCETGCETSCEGWACETAAESGCATTCQTVGVESVFPVREVKVLAPATVQHGAATVIQVDRDGNVFGESFTAWDPFDVHAAADALGTVYLNFNQQWIFVPSHREVKYVQVLDSTAEPAKWLVREQDRTGSGWGASFYAWAVDSV